MRVWLRLARSVTCIVRMRAWSASVIVCACARWRSSDVARVADSTAPSTPTATMMINTALTITSTSAIPD